MRTLFTFALLSAIAFSGVAVGQEETSQVAEIAVEVAETSSADPVSVIDLGAAPSDAEIDTARVENTTTVVDGEIATAVIEYNQDFTQGVSYPENAIIQDCGCQSSTIAPVTYQQPVIEGVVEEAGEISLEGAVEAEPVADATSVVESPITDSAPVYTDGNVVTESQPMVVEGEPMAASTPSCGCNQAAAPTEGLISSSSPVSYESAPVTYSSPAPEAAPCCTPARRGFFRTLFGR
jgi:hypothetical protein